ncbi:MAG: hypothetical protein NBKEAIPA_00711 [Nitrospirae bacterium]|nr:MAG: hypothetical protein UZ03_NOB001001185 [Nitrospira sp. OLB3]MBV6468839.1 hypothetical protein [Nitrospirota bacterium]
MAQTRVTILSRRECHLCRVAHRIARQLQEDLSFDLKEVNVDDDPQLVSRYGNRVPVLLIDDREALAGRLTGGELRAAIKRARWRNPISRILSRVKLALARG